MKNKTKYYLLCIILLVISYYSSAQEFNDAQIKTAYIYKFANFIKWNNEENIDTFRIGVYGDDYDVYSTLIKLAQIRTLKGKPIKIIKYYEIEEITKTQILYISAKRNSECNIIYNKIKGEDTLLITNAYDDISTSMINFIYVDETRWFILNEKNIANENLIILPDLLALQKTKSELKDLYLKTEELLDSEKGTVKIQKEKIEKQKEKIEKQKEEIVKQNEDINNQKEEIRIQQEKISFQENKFNNLFEENKTQQKNLDIKINVLHKKEKEIIKKEEIINLQQKEVEQQKSVLDKQGSEIIEQENKIKSQSDVLNTQLEKIETQQLILILFIVLTVLITVLVIYIYFGYRIKKEKNRALWEKNREIVQQKEQIVEQTDSIVQQASLLEEANIELEKLSIVASKTDNAVIIMDPDGKFEWFNEGFTRIYGYTLEQYINEKGVSIIESSANSEIESLFNECVQKKKSVNYEILFVTKSGKNVWAETTLTPILDKKENIYKIVAIDSDITKIKEAEEQILQQRDEIESQRDEIEAQRDLAVAQRDEIFKQKKEIMDSIVYAKRIQSAILPSQKYIEQILSDYFILYKPKSVVSGDFYWISEINNKIIIAIADCTGHGVPGALMSMISVSFLNRIINGKNILEPEKILDLLKKSTIDALHQTGEEFEAADGMDMALIILDKKSMKMKFAGAMNPLWFYRNGEFNELKGDRMSIGYHEDHDRRYTVSEIQMQKGDVIYMFSDGYVDQFGGNEDTRFTKRNFKALLKEIHLLKMPEQKQKLEENYAKWKGNNIQIDDILVFGTRI